MLGRDERKAANKVASTAIYSSVFVGIVVIAFAIIFLNPILKQLGATESIMPYAATYTQIYIISSIFNVFNVAMNNIVSSEGAAKTTMFVLIAGAVLNVILDPIFIYILNLGVAGAAIATAISQLVSTLIYLWYIFSKKSVFSFRIGECCFSKEIVSEILKIGVPTLVFQLLASLSIALVNDVAKGYGDSVLAAMGSVTRIMSVGSLMVFGFIKGFQPIAGYSYGAQQYDRLQSAIKVSIICFGFYTVYSSLFLALGQAKEGFFLGACRQGICFVPVILMSPMLWGINGILFAQPISDVLSVMITALMAVGLHKKLNTEKEAFIFKNPLN